MDIKICVVGLGYVGLPLAIRFAEHFKVVGFDINKERVDNLNRGIDKNSGVKIDELKKVKDNIVFTNNEKIINECNIIIITVPTPITKDKKSDLRHLKSASEIVGRNLKKRSYCCLRIYHLPWMYRRILLAHIRKRKWYEVRRVPHRLQS